MADIAADNDLTKLFEGMNEYLQTIPSAVPDAIAMVVRDLSMKTNHSVSEGDIRTFVECSLSVACRMLCLQQRLRNTRTTRTTRTTKMILRGGSNDRAMRAMSPSPVQRNTVSTQPVLLLNAPGAGVIQHDKGVPVGDNPFGNVIAGAASGLRSMASIAGRMLRPPVSAVGLVTGYGRDVLKIYRHTAFVDIARKGFGQRTIDLDSILYMVILVMLMVFCYVFMGSYVKDSVFNDGNIAQVDLYAHSLKRLVTFNCFGTKSHTGLANAVQSFHHIDSITRVFETFMTNLKNANIAELWRSVWDIKYKSLIEALDFYDKVDPVCSLSLGSFFRVMEHAVNPNTNIGSIIYLIESYVVAIALEILKLGSGVVMVSLGPLLLLDEVAKNMAGFVLALFMPQHHNRLLRSTSALFAAIKRTAGAACTVSIGSANFFGLNLPSPTIFNTDLHSRAPMRHEAATEVEGGGRRKTNKRKFKSMSGKARRSRNFRVGRSNIKPKNSRKKK